MARPLASAIVIGAIVGAMGCAGSGSAGPPAPVEARVSGLFPKAAGLSTSVLDVRLDMFNPRAAPVTVASVRYVLATGDVSGLIEGSATADARLESEQRAEMGFEIEIPLPPERLAELVTLEMVPADLRGEVTFSDGTTTPFETKLGLAVPSLPSLIVFDAQAAQYETAGIDVTFLLRLLNENSFTLPIQAVEYELEVAGRTMRKEQAGVGTRLTPGAAEEYEVSIQLDASTVEDLQAILASGEVAYRVKGQVDTKEATVPFVHEGKIELGRSE